ncbi:MAG TPA: hypothetical protein VHA75_19280, partial [Rugosimonospora sp.]|nr:hypothetical protein [Rugosimonospora sp.]
MYRSPTVILADWLGSLDVEELAGVLRRRPEVARSPAPRGLGELAERLEWPGGVAAALQSVPLPAAQLLEVVLAAEPPTRDEVARFLGVAPSDLDGPLAELAGRALVWPDGDELRVVQPLVEGNPHPLGLGFTARELIRRWAGAELGVLAQSLGVPTTGRRAAVLDGIEGWYADPERIRATAARAPAGTAELLDELTWQGPEVAVPGVVFHSLDQRIQGPAGWAVRHGLLIMTNWYAGHMPREVALALRGPDWHPPLDLTPPEVALTRVD